MWFERDGRYSRVSFSTIPIRPEGCAEAARALTLASVLPTEELGEEPSRMTLLVPLEPDYLRCLSERRAPPSRVSDGRLRVRGKIDPPKKTRDSAPLYPESARKERIEGIVVLEAVINASGCVDALRTVKNPDDRLTLAAIAAVTLWRYEPTKVDGNPVPITATFTVNFHLN